MCSFIVCVKQNAPVITKKKSFKLCRSGIKKGDEKI